MSKLEFMSELESLLQDISLEEREAAIKYYEDYFEDAGPENEERIMEELGTPARIAAIIQKDIEGARDEYSEGAFTERGFVGANEEKEQFPVSPLVQEKSERNQEHDKCIDGEYRESNQNSDGGNGTNTNSANNSNNTSDTKNKTSYKNETKADHSEDNRKQSNIILIILLIVFGIPIGLPLVCALFGVAVGIAASIFGIFISFVVTAAALAFAGAVMIVFGFGQMIATPAAGIVLIGGGLILLGIGAMLGIFGIWLCIKVLPSFITWVVNLCRKPFQKNKEVAR
jgi:uncharacterized membrane protein